MKRLLVSLTVIVALLAGFTGCSENDDDSALRAITVVSANGKPNLLKPTETLQLEVAFFPESATDREVDWTSSSDHATVDAKGLVTAVSEGLATIKATSKSSPSISNEFAVTIMPAEAVMTTKSGAVEGLWEKNWIVLVDDQIWVEHGKSLTVEEGVTILVQDGRVGVSNAPIEFFVEGSLYLRGTKDNPILVTVADENLRNDPAENKYEGLWGGFVGGNNFEELLFEHVTVEYTGAMVRAGSPSVIHGFNEPDKDRTAQILTNNPDGKIVILNSVFRYAESDAMYFMGGKAIIANNIIHTIGNTEMDGINMKAGVMVDISYNLLFSVNSNALKLSSSGEVPGRDQVVIRAYNNTIVNSGWRREKNLKGGSIFVEQNALATVYNNLIVNCKLMTKTPSLDNPTSNKGGAAWGSIVDHNFYASGSQVLKRDNLFTIGGATIMTAYEGYKYDDPEYWHDWDTYTEKYGPDFPLIDKNSLVATAPGTPDPKFINFPFNTVALEEDMYNPSWDFHVEDNSPVINGYDGVYGPKKDAFTGSYAPLFGPGDGLTVGGKTYTTPLPSGHYGAFGTK